MIIIALLLIFSNLAIAQFNTQAQISLLLQHEAYAGAKTNSSGFQASVMSVHKETGITGRIGVDFFEAFSSNLDRQNYPLSQSSAIELGIGYNKSRLTCLLLLGDNDTSSRLPQHTKYVGLEMNYRLSNAKRFNASLCTAYKRSFGDAITQTNQERDIYNIGVLYSFKICKDQN